MIEFRERLRPPTAAPDVVDRRRMNAIPRSDVVDRPDPCPQTFANIGNLGFGEFGLCAPPDILSVRDGLHVIGIDAEPHTAKMVQIESGRDWPFCSLVRASMGADRRPAIPDLAVSASINRPLPDPTGRVVPSVLNDVFHWRPPSGIVSSDVAVVLSLPDPLVNAGYGGKCRRLSAAAQALTGRVRSFGGKLVAHLKVLSWVPSRGCSKQRPALLCPKLYHDEDINPWFATNTRPEVVRG